MPSSSLPLGRSLTSSLLLPGSVRKPARHAASRKGGQRVGNTSRPLRAAFLEPDVQLGASKKQPRAVLAVRNASRRHERVDARGWAGEVLGGLLDADPLLGSVRATLGDQLGGACSDGLDQLGRQGEG